MNVSKEKSAVRAAVRARLANVPHSRWREGSAVACGRVLAMERWARAGSVMLYAGMGAEIGVDALAHDALARGKRIFAPRLDWASRTMDAAEVRAWDAGPEGLADSERGIRQPARGARGAAAGEIELIIVPGLAFDAECGRLGRGGGFYDRFLGGIGRGATLVGIALEEQIVAKVPRDAWDIAMGFVVTDGRVIESARAPERGEHG